MAKAHPNVDDVREIALMLAKALAPSGIDAEQFYDTDDIAGRLGLSDKPRQRLANESACHSRPVGAGFSGCVTKA